MIYLLTASHVDNGLVSASFVQRIKLGSKISTKEKNDAPSRLYQIQITVLKVLYC